jgi:hypothetical protein
MYIIPETVDVGLLNDQDWPSPEHRQVAQNFALCNSNVNTIDKMIAICQAIIKIPQEKIRTITVAECREVYAVPFI